jgi:adenylate cyclase
MERRLAAILAADVVGYSRLMERDEAGTLAALKSRRAEILQPTVSRHRGRVVKLMGDGVLVEFASAVNAVACAVELQAAMTTANLGATEDRRIVLRIGINLGDIMVEGSDLYGDGVNVAARLEAMAEPGGICVSGKVHDEVTRKLRLAFDFLGERSLKNMAEPVRVYQLSGADGGAPERAEQPLKLSIAVLPFTNMSGDPEQEYFSDGITEDIITDLSKISGLGVIARNTSFQFKGKSVGVPLVAQQLKVSHVLEGSVRKAGGRVRITAQLIGAASGEHVWAERYDRDMKDIFALQDEISEAIVNALKLKLLPEERQAIERRSTTNPEAYKLYLMARHYSVMGTARHQRAIMRLCRRALEIDSEYARAWALLAIGLSLQRMHGEPVEGGMDAADRALALDSSLPDAHAAKGRVLTGLGRYDEAVAELDIALRLDPESYEANAAAARCAMVMRRDDDAIEHLEKAAQVYPTDFWALGVAIQLYEAKGDQVGAKGAARRALDRIEKIIAIEPDHGTAASFAVRALLTLGEAERAMEWAERALLLDPDNGNLHYNLACSMVKAGHVERALELLAGVLERCQSEGLHWARTDTDLDPIRGDARFEAMITAAEARLTAGNITGSSSGS